MATGVKSKSWSESVNEVLKLKTPAQGKLYVSKELRRLRSTSKDWKRLPFAEAKKRWLSNMGYMSGYYDARAAKHVMRIIGAAHPIFGSAR